MLSSLFGQFKQFRQHLTRVEGRPLGKASLLVLIFLDLFILASLFQGLDAQSRQLASPWQAIPSLCRQIIIDQSWLPSTRLDQLAQHTHRSQQQVEDGSDRLHPACRAVLEGLSAIQTDVSARARLTEWHRLGLESSNLQRRSASMKDAYDTRLLEKIADEASAGTPLAAMQAEMGELSHRQNEIASRRASLRSELESEPAIELFFSRLDALGDSERDALREQLRRLEFWFPAQRLGMEVLFLLPLLAIFYFWNRRSLARQHAYQTLVSAHLLAVSLVPLLFQLLKLAHDILPRKFLQQFIATLEALRLVAIWHYLVIAGAILGALALIYFVQQKLFSSERLLLRRLAKGECHRCGLHLPAASAHCPGCGISQYRHCPQCQHRTPVHGRFCSGCGATLPPAVAARPDQSALPPPTTPTAPTPPAQ